MTSPIQVYEICHLRFRCIFQDSLAFIREHTKEIIATTDAHLLFNFLKLFACFYQRFIVSQVRCTSFPSTKGLVKPIFWTQPCQPISQRC